MKKVIHTLIYLSFLLQLLGVSCKKQHVEVEPILQKVETFVEQNPDSALVLLHEITDAQKLKKELYYQYFLLEIQAKYKSYKDITADTLIFSIRDYYNNKNDKEKAGLATFYCGRVFQEQKNYKKALQQFLDAEQYLEQSDNLNLKGLCQNQSWKY